VTFQGDEAMSRRPIADLVEGLRQLGVRVDCASGCPPLTVHGGRLPGGAIRLRGDRSSQYLTALLLVAGLGETDLDIAIAGELVSRPYVAMTCQVAAGFGAAAAERAGGFRAARVPAYRPAALAIEPDASAASYPFALAAAGGHRIAVPGLGTASLQGDYAFVDVLERAGARVERSAQHTVVTGTGALAGIDVNMRHISDTVMSLAAIAPLARGRTTIRDVANIRIKETDRLAAVVAELRRLGQQVEHGDDWLAIDPRGVTPATVMCYSDHRMAMSFAILGCCAPGVVIADPDCTAKTYPGFFADLAALRA
jgi:3-phosphoshikimate 1-carboxyvinyltransferase